MSKQVRRVWWVEMGEADVFSATPKSTGTPMLAIAEERLRELYLKGRLDEAQHALQGKLLQSEEELTQEVAAAIEQIKQEAERE